MGRSLLVDGQEVGSNALVKEAMRLAFRAQNWLIQNPSRVEDVLHNIMEEDPELFVWAVGEARGPGLDEYGLTRAVRKKVEEMMRASRKIDAIKEVRAAIGIGLKEAKDMVEEIERKLTPAP